MQLLGLGAVDTALRVCRHCLHMFRWPLYDERFVYNLEGDRRRKENFEKACPGLTFRSVDGRFDPEWFARTSSVLQYLSRLFASGLPFPKAGLHPGGASEDPRLGRRRRLHRRDRLPGFHQGPRRSLSCLLFRLHGLERAAFTLLRVCEPRRGFSACAL